MVFRLGPLKDSSLIARELAPHRQVACASPAYLAEHSLPAHPRDLLDHACLGYVNWSGLPYADWRFTKGDEVHAVTVRPRFQINDGRVLRAAALEGAGIILQPDVLVRDDIDAGRLTPVLADYAAPSRPMVLLVPTRSPQTPKLRAFIEHAVGALGRKTGD